MKSALALVLFWLFLSITILNGQEPDYSVYLIGDSGKPSTDKADEVFTNLEKRLKSEGKKSAVLFLGDNIYNNGLPPDDRMTLK